MTAGPGVLKLFDPTAVKPGGSLTGNVYVCDVCGKRGHWNDDWRWFGSIADQDDGSMAYLCGCRALSDAEAMRLLKRKRKFAGFALHTKRR